MKSIFSGFYSTNSDSMKRIWLEGSTLFVFDTNCLLNLYRCEDHTREDILRVMREVAPRTWIPFQVGLEYQRNRRSVIEESISSLDKIKNELIKIHTQNILNSGSVKKHLYNSLNDELLELQSQLKGTIEEYITEKIMPRITSKKSISEHDFIRDSIDEILRNRVGSIPTQDRINEINDEGKRRYQNKQPPGFKDDVKQSTSFFSNIELQDKYGDLYLWKEIIEKSKDEEIKNVIFICDDNKNDWWFTHSGKTHGALESLKTEICNNANINNFLLINQLTFLNESNKHLENIKVRDSSLKEVMELSTLNENESKVWSKHTANYYRGYFDGLRPLESIITEEGKIKDINFYENLYYKHENNLLHGIELYEEAMNIISISRDILDEIQPNQTDLIITMGEEYFHNLRGLLAQDLDKLEKFCIRLKSAIKREESMYFDNQETNIKINEIEKVITKLMTRTQEYSDVFRTFLIVL